MILPVWDNRGVLPPVYPGHSGHRSPYRCSIVHLIEQFAITQERIRLLGRMLDYRHELQKAGLNEGFQWLNGSFMQNVELLENRDPKDIDIVTFYVMPPGQTQATLYESHPHLIDPNEAKSNFEMDSYFVTLGEESNRSFVAQVSYWYSMWSHRRADNAWKGFVEIDLSGHEDEQARESLAQASSNIGAET